MTEERVPAPHRDPMLGRAVLGRYRVIKPLAQGGMGVVYLGRTEGAAGFARPVVIKRVLPELLMDPNIAKMFVREAKILSNLHHPGIVGVVDFGEEQGAYIMVLDYVHGYDAGAWLLYLNRQNRRVPIEVAIQIAVRVLEALHYAHTLKRPDGTALTIVHRDISPGNVLLDTEGHVSLLDFGIARISDEANEYRTQETTFKGKLGYAHPSLLARGEPNPQTDVYSTAVVLFQLLTGANPFRGTSPADTLSRVVNLPLPRLREHLPYAPPKLENILLKAMSRDLVFGYPDAMAMAEALRELNQASDAVMTVRMAELFASDFLGELPAELGREPLQVRDAAWRTSVVELPAPGALRSTRPPADSEPPTVIAEPSLTQIDVGAGLTEAAPRTTRGGSGQRLIAAAIALVALALVVLSVVIFTKSEPPSAEARYLVVSKDDGEAANAPESEPPPGEQEPRLAPGAGTATEGVASVAPPPGSASAPGPGVAAPTGRIGDVGGGAQKPTAQLLTQRFSRHQGRVQGCFTANPDQAQQVQSVQIAFTVDASGAVKSVGLIPEALGATALGSCLLAVARQAQFGILTETATFRIPVQARVR